MSAAVAVNHWPSGKCAKAFWSQQEAPPYRRLLADTLDWADPRPGERWLDLGCGGGRLSRGLWEQSGGSIASVLGVDCAPANESAYQKLRETLKPPRAAAIQFQCHDFSAGLPSFADGTFDHAVSGLSISYAEHFDETAGRWTTTAYDRLLAEVRRVVRPGGRFVFSVNVPEPSWLAIAWRSVPAMAAATRPLRHLKNSWRMMQYGKWLKVEARKGRFHYLPADRVAQKLAAAGWAEIQHRLSYSRQAYIFRATNPGRAFGAPSPRPAVHQ